MSDSENKELILNLYFQGTILNGCRVSSGFIRCLTQTREVTGRDMISGRIVDPIKADSWIGAIGYMCLLDQIGKCFKPQKSESFSESNSIESALKYFSDLNLEERKAIYALRCGFTHDFSLQNKHSKPLLSHRFRLDENSEKVVQLPKQQWTGKADNNFTTVNLKLFGDLVEKIVEKIEHLHKKNELEIILKGGTKELVDRYFAMDL